MKAREQLKETLERTHPGFETLAPGGLLAERYRIIELIGEGGFAMVFEAFDELLARPVAIKVLDQYARARPDQRDECLSRFRSEARISARIEHPNVVTIHDMGVVSPGGVPFLVMERLRGHDVETEIKTHGPISPRRALQIAVQSLSALHAAHKMGIVHRDLKPSNLFLTRPGTSVESVKVLDFGIARLMDATDNLTRSGQMIGTARFMTPEYVNRQEVSPRTDIYQMGLVLGEMLTGQPAIEAHSFALALMHVSAGSIKLPEALKGKPIGDVIATATMLEPEDRYENAERFQQALMALDASDTCLPIQASRPPSPVISPTLDSPPPILLRQQDPPIKAAAPRDPSMTHEQGARPAASARAGAAALAAVALLAVSAAAGSAIGRGPKATTTLNEPASAAGPLTPAAPARALAKPFEEQASKHRYLPENTEIAATPDFAKAPPTTLDSPKQDEPSPRQVSSRNPAPGNPSKVRREGSAMAKGTARKSDPIPSTDKKSEAPEPDFMRKRLPD